MGRRKPRKAKITISLPEESRSIIECAAVARNQSMSEFIETAALELAGGERGLPSEEKAGGEKDKGGGWL